jgi:hypothetical protein
MIFLPIVAAVAGDKTLECNVDYGISTLKNSTVLNWNCPTIILHGKNWLSILIFYWKIFLS